MTRSRGFTLIELLLVIGIIAIIAVIIINVFSNFNKNQALTTDTQSVIALLEQARSQTVSSHNASQYGVHLASSTVTLFTGTTYSSSNSSNVVFQLSPTVVISTQSLAGNGVNIVFNRLTGETSQNGTITLRSQTASSTKTVTIYKTGVIESN